MSRYSLVLILSFLFSVVANGQHLSCDSLVVELRNAVLPYNSPADQSVLIDTYSHKGVYKEVRARKNLPSTRTVNQLVKQLKLHCDYTILPKLIEMDSIAGELFKVEFLQSYFYQHNELSVGQYAIFGMLEKLMIPLMIDSMNSENGDRYRIAREQLYLRRSDSKDISARLGVSWISRRGPLNYMRGRGYIFTEYIEERLNDFSECIIADLTGLASVRDSIRGVFYCTLITHFAKNIRDDKVDSVIIDNVDIYEHYGALAHMFGTLGFRAREPGIVFMLDYLIDNSFRTSTMIGSLPTSSDARKIGEQYLISRITQEQDVVYKARAIELLGVYPSESSVDFLIKLIRNKATSQEYQDAALKALRTIRYSKEMRQLGKDMFTKVESVLKKYK